MYLQMLQGAGGPAALGAEESHVADVLSTPELSVDLPLDHFVPRSYIRDERLRLDGYRQLAGAEDEAELESVLRSLRDRYGPAPAQLGQPRVLAAGQAQGPAPRPPRGVEPTAGTSRSRWTRTACWTSRRSRRRFAGRLRVRPNRLLLRAPGRWLAGRADGAAGTTWPRCNGAAAVRVCNA